MPPPRPLDLNEALVAVGRAAERAATLFLLWHTTASHDGHLRHRKVIRRYYENLRFIEHSLLFSAVVGAHNLVCGAKSALTLMRVIKLAKLSDLDVSEAESALAANSITFTKFGILRHEAFAHLSPYWTYDHAFRRADITPNEIMLCCDCALKIINSLLVQVGLPVRVTGTSAVHSYQEMLDELQSRDAVQC